MTIRGQNRQTPCQQHIVSCHLPAEYIKNAPQEATDRDYTVRGCTALLDAIGGAIHHIGNVHKYARPEDVPEHTLFIITTDGMENASRFYSSDR